MTKPDEQPSTVAGTVLAIVLLVAMVSMLIYGLYLVYSMYTIYETNRVINEEIANTDPANHYGCPGCPDNFTDFANDMCSRNPDFTVSDGQNTVKCNSGCK